MSLFKTRQFWSTNCEDEESFDQNSMVVTRLNTDFHLVLLSSHQGVLRIYSPSCDLIENDLAAYKVTDLLIEKNLGRPILQVATGRLVSGSNSTQVAVLQSRYISVYAFNAKEGATDHGTQYVLELLYEHKLKTSSANFVIGPFGGGSTRDFICVQSIDGILTFYEQETPSFYCHLPDFLLPGPIEYSKRFDSFLTCNPNWCLESYSYKQLSECGYPIGEDDAESKKTKSEWSFDIGESVIEIRVLESTANKENVIVILGERNLLCLSDTGKLKYMKKLEYSPICFVAYCLSDMVMSLVVSETSTLLIYQNTSLKWSAQLQFLPVCIKRGFLKNINGAIILLSETGQLECCYLGTEPSLFIAPPISFKELDFEQTEVELANLTEIIKNSYVDDVADISKKREETGLSLLINVDPHLEPCIYENNIKNAINNQMCNVSITIQPNGPISEVQLSIFVEKPLKAMPETEFYSNLEESRLIICKVFPDETSEAPTLKFHAVVSYSSNVGVPRIVTRSTMLPLHLMLESCQPQKESQHKITLNINHSPVPLSTLFPEFMEDDTSNSSGNAIGFKNVTDEEKIATVLLAKSSERYRIQSDSLASLNVLIEQLIYRLRRHFGDLEDFSVTYPSQLPISSSLEYVRAHFDARNRVKSLQVDLNQLSSQFRLIQKRLITKFKVKNPTPLGELNILLDETYKAILKLTAELEEEIGNLTRTQTELACVLNLLTNLMKVMDVPEKVQETLRAILCANINDVDGQNWEDVANAGLCYLLRTSLATTDKEKLRAAHTSFDEIKDISEVEEHITSVLEKTTSKDPDIKMKLATSIIIEETSKPANETTITEKKILMGSQFGESSSRLLSARKNQRGKQTEPEDQLQSAIND